MLPDFVKPMLARLVDEPFDSDEHLFEIKWDGFRALAFIEEGDYRLLTRNENDLKARHPELGFLAGLEPGTLIDGELVAFVDERPSFQAVLRGREPVVYVAFDLLYRHGESWMKRPLLERREELRAVVEAAEEPRLQFSEGVLGNGTALFQEAQRQSLEGVIAKKLESPYQAGRRTGAWQKIKTTQEILCAVLGYAGDRPNDLKSLIVGAEEAGELVCVGRVGSGLSEEDRSRLLAWCREHPREEPLVDCNGLDGYWIEPGLFCKVKYLERTENGLRAPVFVELIQQE